MPLNQLPRLTTTLRASRHQSGYVYDIENAYLERKQILQNKRCKRSATSVGNSELAQKIVHDWETVPVEIRRTYEQFLSAVAELIDGELSTEELHESAGVIYDILHDFDSDSSSSRTTLMNKKESVQRLLGHVASDSSLLKTASLAYRLHKLREEIPVASTAQVAVCMDHGNMKAETEFEFGMDLEFQAPSISPNQDSTEEEIEIFTDTGDIANLNGAKMRDLNNVFPLDYGPQLDLDNRIVNLRWLKEACDQIVAARGGSQVSGDELAMLLCQVLDSDKTGDEIAGEILDMIGDDGFEITQKILQHRKELVDMVHKGLLVLKSEKTSSSSMPSYGTQVSIQTESGRQMEKLRRKEEKRQLKRGVGYELENGFLNGAAGFSALLNASEKKEGVDNLIGKGDDLQSLPGTALPQGTVRKTYKGFEEVRVPAMETASMKPGEKLIEISSLDSFAQTAFEGYKTLNRIQSQIFPTAYHSNENILVCAPTGAGKTNIAMIAVLREIEQHIKNGILHKNEFKIVYVAPMKALAAEVSSAFSRRLSPLNMVVRELTDDCDNT